MEGSGGTPKATLDVGSIITHGWESYVKNIGPFIAMHVIAVVIYGVVMFIFMAPLFMMAFKLKGASPQDLSSGGPAAALAAGGGAMVVVGYILVLLIASFFYGGLIRAYVKATRGETVVINDLFSGGSLFGFMLLGMIVFGIAFAVGTIIPVLGNLFVALVFSLMFFFIVDKKADPFGAMGKSWGVVMANFGPVFVVFLVLAIISVVAGLLAYIPVVGSLANFLVVQPFLLCSAATLYDRLTAETAA